VISLVVSGIAGVILFVSLIWALVTASHGGHADSLKTVFSVLLFIVMIVYVFALILLVSILEDDGVAVSKFDISLSVRHRQVRLSTGKTNQNLQTIEQSPSLTLFISLILIATVCSHVQFFTDSRRNLCMKSASPSPD
jgi:hypothetical protein